MIFLFGLTSLADANEFHVTMIHGKPFIALGFLGKCFVIDCKLYVCDRAAMPTHHVVMLFCGNIEAIVGFV